MLNVGDEVMMMEKEPHAYNPEYYPIKGSIGVVVWYSPDDETALIDWGQDSGVDSNEHDEYAWWCGEKRLAKVNANTQVNAQKGVCNMSKFKVGDKVVFLNADKHKRMSNFYPAVGSIGVVDRVKEECDDDETVKVDWGEAEGLETLNHKKSWWCNEKDIRLYKEYINDEVWEMLKPKMSQFSLPYQNIDSLSQEIKNMVVAAYCSGYGRAIKGRDFMIKSRAYERLSVSEKKVISNVLKDKLIVTLHKEDGSHSVSNFTSFCNAKGFDTINDPDCEMYVAIPFSEAIGQFDEESIKALYCDDKLLVLYHIKQWTIGEYNGMVRFGNKTYASIKFEQDDSESEYYSEIYGSKFKALVPICDYLRVNGVNV